MRIGLMFSHQTIQAKHYFLLIPSSKYLHEPIKNNKITFAKVWFILTFKFR